MAVHVFACLSVDSGPLPARQMNVHIQAPLLHLAGITLPVEGLHTQIVASFGGCVPFPARGLPVAFSGMVVDWWRLRLAEWQPVSVLCGPLLLSWLGSCWLATGR